jgi:hypothetical protein
VRVLRAVWVKIFKFLVGIWERPSARSELAGCSLRLFLRLEWRRELVFVIAAVLWAEGFEDGGVVGSIEVVTLERGFNSLDTQSKVRGIGSVVLADCGLGGGPRLDSHDETTHLLVVDGVVDLSRTWIGR